jgi:uncharacterized protein
VIVRTNVDKRNIDTFGELAALYKIKGWSDRQDFYPYANVIHNYDSDKLTVKPTVLLNKSEALTEEMGKECRPIEISFGVDQVFGQLLQKGGFRSLRPYFCGSNIGSYIFCPDGGIYSCWDEVGQTEGIIGRYFPELSWNEALSTQWIDRNISNMAGCQTCPWALLCGGGCAHAAKQYTGDIFSGFCNEYQETFTRIVPKVYRRLNEARFST